MTMRKQQERAVDGKSEPSERVKCYKSEAAEEVARTTSRQSDAEYFTNAFILSDYDTLSFNYRLRGGHNGTSM